MFLTKLKLATLVGLALGVVVQGAEKTGPKTVSLTDANYAKLRDIVHPTAADLAWKKISVDPHGLGWHRRGPKERQAAPDVDNERPSARLYLRQRRDLQTVSLG